MNGCPRETESGEELQWKQPRQGYGPEEASSPGAGSRQAFPPFKSQYLPSGGVAEGCTWNCVLRRGNLFSGHGGRSLVHTKCGSLLSANLLGQMDSCSSSKGGRQAWGIPEEFRFFMEGQMMPLAVSGRGKKNRKGSFLRDWFSSKLHSAPPPRSCWTPSHFLDEETEARSLSSSHRAEVALDPDLTRAQHKITSKRHLFFFLFFYF